MLKKNKGVGRFGTWLAQRIIDRELNVRDFAKMIQMDGSAIYRHIHCKVYPNWSTVALYARYFGVPYDELAGMVLWDRENEVKEKTYEHETIGSAI